MLKDVIHLNLHSLSFEKALYVQLEHHNGGSTRYTSNFLNSVLEGNISQVLVINNELPHPIQLNIETLSRHETKCTCKFILSVVSKETERQNRYFTMHLLNMTVKVITCSTRDFLYIFVYTYVSTNKILNSYAIAFQMKLFTKTFSHTFESIHCRSMSFDFLSLNIIVCNEIWKSM